MEISFGELIPVSLQKICFFAEITENSSEFLLYLDLWLHISR